jgi:biopolymer transport protein ExbB/biopolymer transport protein TolQ
MHFGLLEIWAAMGPIARAVVGLLLIMSVAAVSVAADRTRAFMRRRTAAAAYLGVVGPKLERGDLVSAAEVRSGGGIGRVIAAGLSTYVDVKRRAPDRDALHGAVEAALDRAIATEQSELRRGLGVLATIGSTAPFVGLFGTVVGIINAFAEIARTGAGGMETVSAGIAEALVATALGILVAVPAVVLFNYFSVRAEAEEGALGDAASTTLEAVRRDAWQREPEREVKAAEPEKNEAVEAEEDG